MRKIIFIIIMILGFGIIGAGVYMQIDTNKNSQSEKTDKTTQGENQEKDKETKKETLENLTRINKYNLPTTCSEFETVETYINTSDYQKITFTYPSCVHEYLLSYWSKILQSEDGNIDLNVVVKRKTLTNYMNEKKTNAIALKNDPQYEVEYTEINKIKNKDNLNVSILETNYQNDYGLGILNYNILDFAVELEEELLLTFEIRTNGSTVPTSVIEELINNIKVEKDAAVFFNTKTEGDYQIGSIRDNLSKSYEHGYIVNYKVPKKYPVIPSIVSNIDSVDFEYEDVQKSLYVNMSIESGISLLSFEDEINQENDISIKNYNDTERYRNFKTTGILLKEINGKKVYYFIYTYDYYYEDKKMHTGYFATVLYELGPQMYLDLYMTTNDIELNEKLISEFLNFTVEEY